MEHIIVHGIENIFIRIIHTFDHLEDVHCTMLTIVRSFDLNIICHCQESKWRFTCEVNRIRLQNIIGDKDNKGVWVNRSIEGQT